MSSEVSALGRCWLAVSVAGWALLGCGGQEAEPEPAAPQTLEQRAQALAAAGAEGPPPALSAEAQAEVRRRSREWAVAAISDTALPAGTVMTVPPLYFGLAFAVDAAASGATRAALREQLAPASPPVQAALQRGLQRRLRAGSATPFDPAFLDAVTAAGQAGTWSRLTLQPLGAEQVAAEPNLRMNIADLASGQWPWPQAEAYDGLHVLADGSRLLVQMLRVQGPVLTRTGAGFEASSLALPGGHWLVRLVPQATPSAWGAAGLSAALAEVVPTLTAQAALAATTGTWRLPVDDSTRGAGLDDRRGMALAMDELQADLRGMGSGGNYLKAPVGSGGLGVSASGFGYSAAQSMDFIFSPRNVFGPGSQSGGSVTIRVTPPPPCPAEPADVRPYFLALVQPGGNIEVLARMANNIARACGGFVIGPPVGP